LVLRRDKAADHRQPGSQRGREASRDARPGMGAAQRQAAGPRLVTAPVVPVRAVIWDFGGVFTTSPFDAFNRYERERGLPVDIIRRINAANPDANAWARIERAEVDAATFDRLFAAEAKLLGHTIPGKDVLALLSGDLRPRVVAAFKACKAKFKVGCIT